MQSKKSFKVALQLTLDVKIFSLQKYSIKPKFVCMAYEDLYHLVFFIQPFSGSCFPSPDPNILLCQCQMIDRSMLFYPRVLSIILYLSLACLARFLFCFVFLGKCLFSIWNSTQEFSLRVILFLVILCLSYLSSNTSHMLVRWSTT